MEKKQNNNEAVRKSSISNIYLCSDFKGNSWQKYLNFVPSKHILIEHFQ